MSQNAKVKKTVTVKFLKNHLHYKKDQVVKANEGMGNYWIKVGVAEEVKRKKPSTTTAK